MTVHWTGHDHGYSCSSISESWEDCAGQTCHRPGFAENRTRRNQDTWNFWAAATVQTTGLITEAWATCQTLRDWAILQPEANNCRLCPWSRNPFLHPWTKGSPPLLFHSLAELLQREERESLESKHIFTQGILSLNLDVTARLRFSNTIVGMEAWGLKGICL